MTWFSIDAQEFQIGKYDRFFHRVTGLAGGRWTIGNGNQKMRADYQSCMMEKRNQKLRAHYFSEASFK